jgi:glycosyltransferase involved in cell wall biosynthesis
MPKFSIVIPTRQRGVNLRDSIPTVLRQTDPDLELIIQDNCSTDSTESVVKSFNDDRIRYHRSDAPLSMHDNWEAALDLISGDYVIYVGDDDGLMPDCLEKCRLILDNNQTHLIKYNCHSYGWPNHRSELRRDRLSVSLSRGYLRRMSSRDVLQNIYNWRTSIWDGPGIYNGLVSRDLIDKIRKEIGGYSNVDPQPDFSSILLNLGFSESFIQCDAPLGMIGWSGLSNGGAFLNHEASREATARWIRETGRSETQLAAEGLPGVSMTAAMLAILQRIKIRVFHNDSSLEINHKNSFFNLVSNIHDGSLPYNEYVRTIEEYAKYLGIPLDTISIPEPVEMKAPLGTLFNPSVHTAEMLRLDGKALGIADLRQAVAIAFALTGPAELPSVVATTDDRSPSGVIAALKNKLAARDDEISEGWRNAMERWERNGEKAIEREWPEQVAGVWQRMACATARWCHAGWRRWRSMRSGARSPRKTERELGVQYTGPEASDRWRSATKAFMTAEARRDAAQADLDRAWDRLCPTDPRQTSNSRPVIRRQSPD